MDNQLEWASTYEQYIGSALIKAGWTFDYQVPLFGGRTIAGGTVADFIVHTPIKPTPLYVQGEYWHKNQKDRDRIIEILILSRLGHIYANPIFVEEEDCNTPENAERFILKTFGRGR